MIKERAVETYWFGKENERIQREKFEGVRTRDLKIDIVGVTEAEN